MWRPALSGRWLHSSKSNFHPPWSLSITAHNGPEIYFASGRRTFSLALGPSRSFRRRALPEADKLSLSVPASESLDGEDLTFAEALKDTVVRMLSKRRKPTQDPEILAKPMGLGNSMYGKWQYLTMDDEALRRETDIKASDRAQLRLIDQPGNDSDMELWACLMESVHRRMGYEGVVMLWQSVLKKKTLHQVDGPLPEAFWGRILNAAVTNDAFLREVVDYAAWLYQEHELQWPKLYSTVMRHMLPKGDKTQVLEWHMALVSLFPLEEAEFAQVLREHVTLPQPEVQECLQTLYKTARHRNMYDLILPDLYSQGHDFLARRWRAVFLKFNDKPKSSVARPFIRYLMAYYSIGSKFTDEEVAVAGWSTQASSDTSDGNTDSYTRFRSQDLRYLVNRVHGETFGIDEKPYNDKLGARWLASTWVSLDFAINVLHTLGVQDIGPLSVRAIAWREQNAQALVIRFNQLGRWGIRIPQSNYVRALRHHANAGDDEALMELVQSEIHPDFFEDEKAQRKSLAHCFHMGDWTTCQLILKTMVAVSSDNMYVKSNTVLETTLRQGNGAMALRIMQELRSQRVDVTPKASHLVSTFVATKLQRHRGLPEERQHVDLCQSLCRELASTRYPPAVAAWQAVLHRLGREGRLHDLERLSLEICEMFTRFSNSRSPMWACANVDVPAALRDMSPHEDFRQLPRDLRFRRKHHPLMLIFDRNMQNSIVRWGFIHTRYHPTAEVLATVLLNDKNTTTTGKKSLPDYASPCQYHFARGIRLIAMLRDRGVFYLGENLKKQVRLRLSDLYRGGGKVTYEWIGGDRRERDRRRRNRLNLAEAKQLCDKAWDPTGELGEEITPSLFELEKMLGAVEVNDRVDAMHRTGEELWRNLTGTFPPP